MWNKLLAWMHENGYVTYDTYHESAKCTLAGANDPILEQMEADAIIEQMRQLREANKTEAQRIVNRALAHYCEHCDRAFSDTGACKMHKRFKHKTI